MANQHEKPPQVSGKYIHLPQPKGEEPYPPQHHDATLGVGDHGADEVIEFEGSMAETLAHHAAIDAKLKTPMGGEEEHNRRLNSGELTSSQERYLELSHKLGEGKLELPHNNELLKDMKGIDAADWASWGLTAHEVAQGGRKPIVAVDPLDEVKDKIGDARKRELGKIAVLALGYQGGRKPIVAVDPLDEVKDKIWDARKRELGKTTNPKDLIGITKPNLFLNPPSAAIYQALAFADGARKYGPYNWRENKVVASIYIAALQRHIADWIDGQECAEDSEAPHLGHAMACIAIIIDALETGNLVDDRPLPGCAPKLLAKWTKDKKS